MQRKRWLYVIVILALVAAGGWYWWSRNNAKPVQPMGQIIRIERGELVSQVSATGAITPVNMVDVSSKITGRIEEVKVLENQLVKTGDVLITLDDTRLQAQLAQVQSRLKNTEANYRRSLQLVQSGAVPVQQYDAARMDYEVAKANYDDMVSQLEDTIIRAPVSGMVIGKPIPAGQTVSPGISNPMVLMTIADMSVMQIYTQVDESDIGKVNMGQKATFTVDAYPGKTFTGKVSLISSKATIQQNVVYYNVVIDVDNPQNLLKPTMTARVSVQVGERQDVVTVPLMAVKSVKGQQYVQVLSGDQVEQRAITLGLVSDERAEVLTGLAEGEQVVLPSSRTQTQSGTGGGSAVSPGTFRAITGR